MPTSSALTLTVPPVELNPAAQRRKQKFEQIRQFRRLAGLDRLGPQARPS
jgi:hypothetical protein